MKDFKTVTKSKQPVKKVVKKVNPQERYLFILD